ncbi:MAG: hypothetical protein ABIW76_22320 [Fibrobacteria bacterium]
MSKRVPNPLYHVLIAALSTALLSLLGACAGNAGQGNKSSVKVNLDSLHQVNQHNDSIESNLVFYEHTFDDYKARFPGVAKPDFMRIAKGKDQDFCLFKPNPAQVCLEVADKFNDLNLKQPAKDAYEAGLLSEGYNGDKINVRLWASLGQLSVEEKNYVTGKSYLTKVLEVEPKNKWAKKMIASIPNQ